MQADSVHYRLVYDAAAAGYTDWSFPAVGLALLAVFSVLLYRHRRAGGGGAGRRAWLLYAGVPFFALWVLLAGAGTYGGYARLRDALHHGRYAVVEGTVRDFHPGDSGDHTPESWSVESAGRVHFYSYVRSQLTPGFRWVAVHGGPIRPGLRVRVAEVDGYIARLEVADPR